ncbi:MAG TPA: YbdK family carboxylate-amine ligase [Baekduia sp.]|nr:YbdK family carboxylate-amine ligase [Baekduia sp.]
MTDGVEEAFAASTDATIGLEEEFALLDPHSLEMVPRYEELRDACDGELAQSVAGELIVSEIEIRSGRGDSFAAAVAAQRDHRRGLFAAAEAKGIALGSTGTHPWADYRDVEFIDTEHYRRVSEGLQLVARRNVTFSLHVHVGIKGADRAIKVCDRLRPVLPQLLAISANSPFVDGLDSGLHSARTQLFTKSFPRCGIPDPFGTWDEYRRYIEFLEKTNSIVEYTQVWWSVRPHFSFGTVEVRICDAQSTATESEALAGLIAGCVLQAARDIDDGKSFEAPAGRLIEENFWRAIRHGRDGRLIDLTSAREVEMDAVIDQLLHWTAPVRGEHGIEVELPRRGGAQRQRESLRGMSLREAYAATVAETRQSYTQEVSAA